MFEINFNDTKKFVQDLTYIVVPHDENFKLSKITLNNHILKLYGTLYHYLVTKEITINLNNVTMCDINYIRNDDITEITLVNSEKNDCNGFNLTLDSLSIQLVTHDEEMKKLFFVLLEKIEKIMEKDCVLDNKSKLEDIFDFLIHKDQFNKNKKKNFYEESDEEN